jgi:ubiquinone/menaquinone biosynthesis C-methylase UbiE
MTYPGITAPAKEAFSRQAPEFDAIDEANPLIGWVRDRVRRASMRFIRPGQTILELNAGTGIDSTYFARQGAQVLATDQAPGMLAQLRSKQQPGLPLEVMELSYLELEHLHGRTFDHVFSNFGGLNCTDRLDKVMRDAHSLLKPGGCMHLVIMPRICPWELGWVLRGRPRSAFRRFRKGGTPAHLEGVTFECHYHSPTEVLRMLPAGYSVRKLMALSLTYPPPHAQAIAAGWPRLTRALARLEDSLCELPPFRNWGDHYLLIVQLPQ